MKFLLSGSNGLIGTALKLNLEDCGHKVIPLSRDFESPIDFDGIDAVVHLAGESIAEGRWNKQKKMRIEKSRVTGTQLLSKQIALSPHKPIVFITASAIGYYGDRGNEVLDENSTQGKGFLSQVCSKWEASTRAAEEAGVRTINMRTGIVLSKNGGALTRMLTPFKMGAGGILGNGAQYMSWISMDDMIEAIKFLVDKDDAHGPVNLVSPQPVSNHTFTKILGHELHRPAVMPLPAFAARILFGEMADALLLSSTRVAPAKLLEYGYVFKYRDLESALRKILA